MSTENQNTISALLHPKLVGEVPENEMCRHALELAYSALPAPIFNHSFRVYLLSKWLAAQEAVKYEDRLLFMACICHDFGASDMYNGEERFEVEGADAACDLMKQAKCDEDGCHKVWTAIALHTSAGIAERIDPFTRLVRLGVKIDFSSSVRELHGATAYSKEIEQYLPRLDIEKALADSVIRQARKIPENLDSKTWPDSLKHPKASWPGILLRAHVQNPDWDGVNLAF